MSQVMTTTPANRQREEKYLDKAVQQILAWDGLHNFASTPLWINTMLNSLPDTIMMSRAENEWEVSVGEITVTGWTLPVALARMIYAIDKEVD